MVLHAARVALASENGQVYFDGMIRLNPLIIL